MLAPNIATANEGPHTMPVFRHNEFGLSPHFPDYVFFYCVSVPETGTSFSAQILLLLSFFCAVSLVVVVVFCSLVCLGADLGDNRG